MSSPWRAILKTEEVMSKKMISGLMKQAQKMQEEMARVQTEAASKTVEASAGGGMVSVIANGANEIVSVKIEKEVVNPDDVDMLQDLIVAAANEALRRIQDEIQQEMGKLTGGLNLPGMGDLGGLFGK